MAQWKKLVVSGSNISQLTNDLNYARNGVANQSITGSLLTNILQGTGSLFLQPDNTDARKLEIYNTSVSDVHIKATGGQTFLGDDTNFVEINDSTQVVNITAVNGVYISTFASGSFQGTFTGDGSGITNVSADSIAFGDITDKPTLVSGSSQITITGTTGFSDFNTAISSSIDTKIDAISINVYGDSGVLAVGNGDSFDIYGGTGISSSISGQSVTLNLEDTAVTAGSYGSATEIPTFTVDAQGRITAASTESISTTLIVSGSEGGATVELGSETLTIEGTDNQIETLASGQTITIGLPANVTITEDLTVGGDLIVQGTVTNINTTNLDVEDAFILLNSGSAATGDSGFVFGGSNGTAQSGAGLIWDASYNSNDGRLAVVADMASDATGAQTPAYHIAGVFAGNATDAATAEADHVGNIRVDGDDIFIYV